MPGPGKQRGFAKPKDVKGTFLRLLSYLKPHLPVMIAVILCMIVSSLGGVLGTYLLKPIFNLAAEQLSTGGHDFSRIIYYIVLLAAIYILAAGVNFLAKRLLLKTSVDVLLLIRTQMFEHLQRLPVKYFDERTHGEIMSRFTNDTDTLREMLSNAIPGLVTSTVTILGVVFFMIRLSWRLTLVVLCAFVLMLLVVKTLGKRSVSYFRKRQAAMAETNGYIEEMIAGQREVKAFCHEEKAEQSFAGLAEKLRDVSTKATAYSMTLMPIMGNLNYILFAATAVTGTLLIINGATDIGTLAAFLQYTRQFGNPITQVSQQANTILNALAGAERIFALLDTPEEADEGTVTLKKVEDGWAWIKTDGTSVPLRGDVRFEDVTFSYDGKVDVLKDISLYAKPGQKIAFVGSTGAGKTTITNLINRFYDLKQGRILYDGIDVQDIKKDDLRRSLTMVLQDTHLFTGSVKENIRFGRLDATDEEVEEAAKLANAHFFISHLPQGYDTILTADGANLSQGQRQLIAIARAAVADPPVLVLDEATSSIDTRTEALIEKGMDTLMHGRTVFVIAHRLSTVRNANAILVLEHGEIIERGDHESLLRDKGKYYQLYMGLFELS